jgi:UDP:flavonoid glycosyltransferase YjiC (YdhE family)
LVNFPTLPIPGYNQLTYTLGERVVWKMFQKTINRWRNETHNLPPVTFESYFHSRGTARMPIINGFSPAVVSRPPDWGDEIHITGYWFPEDKAWQPPVDLVAFLEGGPPPVFIGFGSMPVKNPIQTTRVILEALQTTDQRAVLGDGWSGIGDQALPETVYKIQYAPYEWLFPKMAMVIHHGGSGTTAAGLRAGVPSCAVPFLFDQEYWGKRIASLGVGPHPIPYRKLSAFRLVRNINQGINDLEIRENAKKLGQRIRTENGVQTAVKIVNRYLWVK